jgi:hypothetical protein
MLAANVRQFRADLWDRERCRQLLATVEFIQSLTSPPGSSIWFPVVPLKLTSVLKVAIGHGHVYKRAGGHRISTILRGLEQGYDPPGR